ncbi:hypothetical protein BJ138DRAFT_1098218 [Hygrophoropsis aurantiaca]|uniref:Uncharacterized protein n=1 Tax=Hygrophoropsis aurantiaca TaxID=72124 RepID=A0ACB8ANK1_9AGAM|nr:hypothetical protein BJ138DRAFT_1098218 [Hygrophoropsis aurantiaca]
MDHSAQTTNASRLHPDAATPTDRRSNSSSPALPEIPPAELDLTFSLDSIIGPSSPFANSSDPHAEKVIKRASNVMKLTQENEKLKEELRAMTARIEAAERKRLELSKLQQASQAGTTKANQS